MLDLFKEARWDELYVFFAAGHPPLMAQLMALNTIIFMLFIVRRMRGAKTMRSDTASMIQSLMLFANMLVVFRENITRSLSWLI